MAQLARLPHLRVKKITQAIKFCFLALILSVNLLAVPTTQAALSGCAAVNDPTQTKGLIITIIEEPIAGGTTTGDQGQILTCMRKSCKDGSCKEEYQEVGGGCDPSAFICKRIQVFAASSGAQLLYTYIGVIYRWAASTIGVVCVLFMVYYGIRIAAAGDNAGVIDEAKQKIFQSLAGLILLFLSAVILYTINPNFFTV